MGDKQSRRLIIVLSAVFIVLMYSWISTEWSRRNAEAAPKEAGETTLYENAWIVKLEKGKLLLYKDGGFLEFSVNSSGVLNDVLADVTVTDGLVTHISIKNDTIPGKVLSVSEDSMELEGYGRIPIASDAVVLKNYGELTCVEVKDVVVGYTSQKIIISEGEICGVIINEPVMADKIRVLIMTDNYAGTYHDSVVLSSDTGLVTEVSGIRTEYQAGEKVVFDADMFGDAERINVRPLPGEDGRLKLWSVERACGNPVYRGSFELVKDLDKGIMVINEVSLEEYLYAVVPSEMPAGYGVEALKAQAVCARSYAYKQILENKLGGCGAHVNDSSQFQVYNNIGEHDNAIRAVDETRGQILTYEGEVVEAYYFSTSCGHTTDAAVWGGDNPGYIRGRLINGSDTGLILDTEEKFSEFIKNKSYESYDMQYEWYRWEILFSEASLNGLIKKAGLYDEVGSVEEVEVIERGSGGIVNKLKLTGSRGSVIIEKEYTIRQLFCPDGLDIVRNDGTVVNNFSLLPSAYFVIEEEGEGANTGYRIFGGGFGHGVGMSQKGAKAMTDAGFMYDEVLAYFYNDISIADCYYEN